MTDKTRLWTETGRTVGRLSFPPFFGYFVVPLALFMLLGANPLLGLLSIAALIIGVGLLWRPGEVPILLFFFGWQWIQASLSLIRSSISGEPLAEMVPFASQMDMATMLALFGLTALAVGLHVAAGPRDPILQQRHRQEVCRIRVERWAIAYALAFVASLALYELAVIIRPLAQPLMALANLKWGFFIAFTFAVFARPSGYRGLWLIFFTVEFMFSLGGYFSSFRIVFIMAFLALLASGARIEAKHAVPLVLITVATLSLGVVWTAIKNDYRSYVNAGTNTQSVLVSRTEQVQRMVELSQRLSADDFSNAMEALSDRISYVHIFGATLLYVPEVRPHTNGDILLTSLTYPFMPRALFPQKPIIDESLHTNEFTNLEVAGIEQGTQVSIGYIGDAYIDFGKFGMMGLMFVIGLVFGRFYRNMVRGRRMWGILGGGIAASVMVHMADMGFSMTKLGGTTVLTFVVIWIANRTVFPTVRRWLGLTRARPFRLASRIAKSGTLS